MNMSQIEVDLLIDVGILTKQRDELLAALRGLVSTYRPEDSTYDLAVARDAIAATEQSNKTNGD